VLRDDLVGYRARVGDLRGDALVFATSTGNALSKTNVRRRILAKVAAVAATGAEEAAAEPLPDGLTPHSLRRTFASLLYALGEAPPYVMAQMGHTSPNLALAI